MNWILRQAFGKYLIRFTISVISVTLSFSIFLFLSVAVYAFACFSVFNFVLVGFQQLEKQHMADKKIISTKRGSYQNIIFFCLSPSLSTPFTKAFILTLDWWLICWASVFCAWNCCCLSCHHITHKNANKCELKQGKVFFFSNFWK